MSDMHAAWARENVKAAEEAPDPNMFAVDIFAGMYGLIRGPGESVEALGERLCEYLMTHYNGTPVGPSDPPMGQDLSQDRPDSDETSSDTNPCK